MAKSNHSRMLLGLSLVAVVAILTVGYLVYASRRALVASYTTVFGRVAVHYVAQYVRENNGRWPRSWDDLKSLQSPPIVFERSDPAEMLETCRKRVEIDFGAVPHVLASQSVQEFDSIRPLNGHGLDYRESWDIDMLLNVVREFHRSQTLPDSAQSMPAESGIQAGTPSL